MRVDVIGTGSSGNAYAVHAGGEILLLDAGLPVKAILRGIPEFAQTGIAGCLVTHEHGDHAKSALALAALGVPVYASKGTIDAIIEKGSLTRLNAVQARSTFTVGGFVILPFEAQHDAFEPLGFLVKYQPTGETLLYATDTYYLRYTFPGVNYWLVECNYIDEIMASQLESGRLTDKLRNRLDGSHMSLRRLLATLEANDLSDTRAIVLVHLSDERSDEAAMVRAVKEVTGIEEVVAAANGMSINLELTPF